MRLSPQALSHYPHPRVPIPYQSFKQCVLIRLRATRAASVVLVSSNPTNLVLSGAFALSFLSYAAHVVLPFAAAALCVFPLLLTLFRCKDQDQEQERERGREREPILIPRRSEIGLAAVEGRATLVDARGAAFGSALLLVTLGVLVGVSTVGVPVWEVTVPPAVVMFGRDVWHDWDAGRARANLEAKPHQRLGPGPERDRETEVAGAEGQVNENGCPGEGENGDAVRRRDGVRSAGDADGDGDVEEEHALHDLSSRTPTLAPELSSPISFADALLLKQRPPFSLLSLLSQPLLKLAAAFPTTAHVLERLPLALVPFALLMFVLVQGLAAQGWVALFARGWAAWVRATGILGAIGGMGVLACLLCNVRVSFFLGVHCHPCTS